MNTRNTLTTCLLFTGLMAAAQAKPEPTPGILLEKAGKNKNTAIGITLGGAALAGMVIAMDSDNAGPAAGIGAAFCIVGLGINIGANNKIRKAGRKLGEMGY